MKKIVMLTILMAALAGCVSSVPPLPEEQAGVYRLGPGDELQIEFYQLTELSNTYIVSDTGHISAPLLNQVEAGGKTVEELEAALEKAILEQNLIRKPDVAAQVSKYRPYFIVGEVRNPGQYDYQPNMSVLVAISAAGGPTFRARTDRVIITRRDGAKWAKGKARPESLVLPGDTIEVKEKWF
jgi:polysaccharide export outer membrane protein